MGLKGMFWCRSWLVGSRIGSFVSSICLVGWQVLVRWLVCSFLLENSGSIRFVNRTSFESHLNSWFSFISSVNFRNDGSLPEPVLRESSRFCDLSMSLHNFMCWVNTLFPIRAIGFWSDRFSKRKETSLHELEWALFQHRVDGVLVFFLFGQVIGRCHLVL